MVEAAKAAEEMAAAARVVAAREAAATEVEAMGALPSAASRRAHLRRGRPITRQPRGEPDGVRLHTCPHWRRQPVGCFRGMRPGPCRLVAAAEAARHRIRRGARSLHCQLDAAFSDSPLARRRDRRERAM
jgi:hypothetical protein